MRQIKFRAWHKLTKKIIIIDAILWSTHGYLGHTSDGFSGSGSLDDIELLQFTGSQDRNGKDIYEGDILQWGTNDAYPNKRIYKRAVTYENKRAMFLPNVEGDEEIIGNIYEHPDLLAKEQ